MGPGPLRIFSHSTKKKVEWGTRRRKQEDGPIGHHAIHVEQHQLDFLRALVRHGGAEGLIFASRRAPRAPPGSTQVRGHNAWAATYRPPIPGKNCLLSGQNENRIRNNLDVGFDTQSSGKARGVSVPASIRRGRSAKPSVKSKEIRVWRDYLRKSGLAVTLAW